MCVQIVRINLKKIDKKGEIAMADFSQAKVGDKVWSPMFGWGIVINRTSVKSITVQPKEGTQYWLFTNDGRLHLYAYLIDGPQCLFWDEVKIVPPPKPNTDAFTISISDSFVNMSYSLPIGDKYSIHDVKAVIEKAFNVKCAELGSTVVSSPKPKKIKCKACNEADTADYRFADHLRQWHYL